MAWFRQMFTIIKLVTLRHIGSDGWPDQQRDKDKTLREQPLRTTPETCDHLHHVYQEWKINFVSWTMNIQHPLDWKGTFLMYISWYQTNAHFYQDPQRLKSTFLMYISTMALGQQTTSTSRSAMLVGKSLWSKIVIRWLWLWSKIVIRWLWLKQK